MKKLLPLLALTLVNLTLYAQDFRSDFISHFQQGNTIQQLSTLKNWQKAQPNDPELFTMYFNFYFNKAKQEVVQLSPTPLSGEQLSLSNTEQETVGYLGSELHYKPADIALSLDWINRGIAQNPARLDMRFGKIFLLGQVENWHQFTQEIIQTIAHSNQINHQWLWTFNQELEQPEAFFYDSLQDYQATLFETQEDALLVDVRKIAETVLKFNPNHAVSLSNIGTTYAYENENKKALDYFILAEKLEPNDVIILGNIAHIHSLLANAQQAITYYEKLIAVDSNNQNEYQKRIDLLRKE